MPQSDHWAEIERLFEAAGEIPEAQRPAFLSAEAQGDENLVAEVLDLLRHSEAAGAAWGESAVEFGQPLLEEQEENGYRKGERIGIYEIEERLGRGGMGTVWLARRTDDMKLRVALKIVRRGLDTEDVRHRFLQERRLLAALDHPHVARLLDGGVTPDGLPYFVMEYVDGQPIDAFCDAESLSIEERLRLFKDVCDTVQYAHQHLVVHRDLKPSNILVTKSPDGKPFVKLLDFGIAKVHSPDDLGLSGVHTSLEQRLLTPAYASPEQLDGGEVTTASDVFQLGALLYELITGHPALERARPPSSPRTEPTHPSEIVRRTVTRTRTDGTRDDLTPQHVSRARGATPDRLRRALSGNLDTMVLKALHEDPARRYASAAQLGEDIGRHLSGQAILARPDTLAYRAAVFLRRHRVGAAVIALILLILATSTLFYSLERNRAAQEAAKARAVSDVLKGIFAATNPLVSQGDTLTVYDILRHSDATLRDDLKDQPEVLAEVLNVIGAAFRDLKEFERAESALEDALQLRRRTGRRNDPALAEVLDDLAALHFIRGDYERGLTYAREHLAVLLSLYGNRDPRVTSGYTRLAAFHLQTGRVEDARMALDAGLSITRPHSLSLAEFHLALVGLESWYFSETERYREAIAVAHEILDLRTRIDDSVANVALTERILGSLYYQIGAFDRALLYLDRAGTHYRRVYGPDNRYSAIVIGHLAEVHAAAGKHRIADSLFALALPLKEEHYGPLSGEVASTLITAGQHEGNQGRLSRADTLLARAETVWSTIRSPEHRLRHRASALRALVRFDLGHTTEAADTLESIWSRVQGDSPVRTRAVIQFVLSELRRRQGRIAEAESLLAACTPELRDSPFRLELERRSR